ncbi:MAG: monovalent cation/H(+) antiporter subunit G [Planctomycetota bacterium]
MLLDVLSVAFLIVGCLFALTGALGMLRMPDFYTRLHPAGKGDTLAQFLILCGLLMQADSLLTASKLFLISLILFVTCPTATHAITLAAHLDGLKPWRKEEAADG